MFDVHTQQRVDVEQLPAGGLLLDPIAGMQPRRRGNVDPARPSVTGSVTPSGRELLMDGEGFVVAALHRRGDGEVVAGRHRGERFTDTVGEQRVRADFDEGGRAFRRQSATAWLNRTGLRRLATQ